MQVTHAGVADGTALSVRECGVANLIASGYSDKQIGVTLGLARGTVRTYVARIFRKLHVSNRAMIASVVAIAPVCPHNHTGDGLPVALLVVSKAD
jgi:DNA-binding NarL/FixJ family response regulator